MFKANVQNLGFHELTLFSCIFTSSDILAECTKISLFYLMCVSFFAQTLTSLLVHVNTAPACILPSLQKAFINNSVIKSALFLDPAFMF